MANVEDIAQEQHYRKTHNKVFCHLCGKNKTCRDLNTKNNCVHFELLGTTDEIFSDSEFLNGGRIL